LYSNFLVSDKEKGKEKENKKPTDYTDLSDSDDKSSKGGGDEYCSTETKESVEITPPQKTTKHQEKPTQSMRQQTMTQLYRTPVVTPLAASAYGTLNAREGNFMPPYFIAPYKTDAVNMNVGIVILLPAGVASRNIHDISVWMEDDPTTLCIRIKIPDFMTRLMFFPSLLSFKQRGQPVYPITQMTRFKDGLEEFIFELRATVHDDIFYTARIPVENYNVVPDIEDNDWQVMEEPIVIFHC